jgi:GDP-mannose 6-dehydrogenase
MRRDLQLQLAVQSAGALPNGAMSISVFGLGYVGAVSLACLARDGHTVVGVDIDESKLALIRTGKTPVVEEGMVELMSRISANVTTDVGAAVQATELSFVCVGTPSAPNGSQDQSAVVKLARDIGRSLRDKAAGHVIVFRSTLVPGTVEEVLIPILEQESGKSEGADFHVCFQPEFLREGTSLRDYDTPPYTIVGARSDAGAAKLRRLFGHLPCDFHVTSIRSAEMVKYCCNNFHALKITFANETARLCEALGVDPFEVMDLVCKDKQLNISPAYLKPGFAFGGSCLPKDLRATMHIAKTRDVELPMLGNIAASNRLHVELAISKVLWTGKRRVGMLGLAFKSGTDDLRESPFVLLAEQLIGKGIQLRIYDPDVHLSQLLGANRRFIERHLPHIGSLLSPSFEEVLSSSDLLVVGMKDNRTLDLLEKHLRPEQLVIDVVRIPPERRFASRVLGLCW